MANSKHTLVLGASPNPERYSFLAINRLRANGHPVTAIGQRPGVAGDTQIIADRPALEDVDTITLYMNPQRQKEYYEYILSLHPKRIIFNPGAENPELSKMAKEQGIQPMEACTLVMLGTGQF